MATEQDENRTAKQILPEAIKIGDYMQDPFSDPLFRALFVGALISLPFKVVSLWKSAQNNQKGWFAAFLLFNTVGILELVYLFYFSKPKTKN